VVVLFKLFAKTEKITMEDSRKANGMLKYRLHQATVTRVFNRKSTVAFILLKEFRCEQSFLDAQIMIKGCVAELLGLNKKTN
jgi:hypothetical protein